MIVDCLVNSHLSSDATLFNQDGSAALFVAACNGHLEVVSKLLDEGIDVNATLEVSTVRAYAHFKGRFLIGFRAQGFNWFLRVHIYGATDHKSQQTVRYYTVRYGTVLNSANENDGSEISLPLNASLYGYEFFCHCHFHRTVQYSTVSGISWPHDQIP